LALALSVTPPRTEVRLPPGGVTQIVLTVSNPHAEPYDVELSQKPWFVYPDNKKIQVQDWMELPGKKQFRLKPGKSRDIKISIRCPKEAVGELMGMVSFAYQGLQASMMTPMISTAVYLEVTGTEKVLGEIVALGAGTRNGRFQVAAQVKATGNVRLRPVGSLQILDDKGAPVADYAVPEAQPLFPGQARDCVGQGPSKPPAAGHYTLSAKLVSGPLELKEERGMVVKANGDVDMEAKKL
jgi:hypothetical protein